MTPAAEEATVTAVNNNNNDNPNHNSMSSMNQEDNSFATPSQVVKTKWKDVIDHLPNENLASITRTYTNRLHQLRLQRERHQATHDRNTKDDATLPISCAIHFELGATGPAIKERAEYQQLKERVEATIKATETTLKNAITELQIIEMQAKEEEIRKTYCEGLSKIANALIHYHRDHPSNNTTNKEPPIDKSMQTTRLADRLVEMLLSKDYHPELMEHSYLQDFHQYYEQVGRDAPTHSKQQNRDTKSSPYNSHHTKFLQGILEEFKNIIEPCFHASWNEYLSARTKLHKQQSQQKLSISAHNHNEESISNLYNNNNNTKRRLSVSDKRNSSRNMDSISDLRSLTSEPHAPRRRSSARISFVDHHHHNNTSHQHQHHNNHNNHQMTSADLRGMVKDVVSEETKGLRDSIKRVEEQLQKVIKEVAEDDDDDDDEEAEEDSEEQEDAKVEGILKNQDNQTKNEDGESEKDEGAWETVPVNRRGSRGARQNSGPKKNAPQNNGAAAKRDNGENNNNKSGLSYKAALAKKKEEENEEEDEEEHNEFADDTKDNTNNRPKRGKRRSRKKGKGSAAANSNANTIGGTVNGMAKKAGNGKKETSSPAAEGNNGTKKRESITISESSNNQSTRRGGMAETSMDDSTTRMFGDLQSGTRRAWG